MAIKLTKKQQKQYDILAEAMDAREKPFKLIKDYENMFGFVPAQFQHGYEKDGVLIGGAEFMANYEEYKRIGSWRNQKGIVEKIIKAAIKAAEKEK